MEHCGLVTDFEVNFPSALDRLVGKDGPTISLKMGHYDITHEINYSATYWFLFSTYLKKNVKRFHMR